jgi:hypothetical protein
MEREPAIQTDSPAKPIFSVRIGLDWRAVCVRTGDVVLWYFIGSHADYDRLIKTL